MIICFIMLPYSDYLFTKNVLYSSYLLLLCFCNNINFFVKQNSQLDRLPETLKMLTSSLCIEVTAEGVMELKTVIDFGK